MDLVVRTTVDPASLTSALRREIHALDPSLPFYDVHTLDEAVERSVGTRRLTNRLLAWFSIAAVALASLGIYGVTALSVGQRVQEFGVRLALGASRAAVLRLVLRQGLTLAIIGVAIGLAGAAWLTQYVSTLLFNVAPLDPGDLRGGDADARRRRADRVLRAGPPRDPHGSPGGAATPVAGTSRRRRCLTLHEGLRDVSALPAAAPMGGRGSASIPPRRPSMSDQPRPSHELFHDVTDTRPRAGRAAGGTLAVSIVAHALILAAVIVVPLLATDTLPDLVDTVGVFRPDPLPPPDAATAGHQPHTHGGEADAGERRARRASGRDRRRAAARAAGRVRGLCRRSERSDRASSASKAGPATAVPQPPPPPPPAAEAGAPERLRDAAQDARRRADVSDHRAHRRASRAW